VVRAWRDTFALRTRLRAKFLYTSTASAEAAAPRHGFQIRRARVAFTGHGFGVHNKFKIELAVSPRDINLADGAVRRSPLLDGYVTFDHLQSLTLRLGQYKVPYSRQRVISSGDLEFVDRSIVNREFNLDRDLGLDLRSKDLFGWGKLQYFLGIYMGEGHSSSQLGGFGMMYIARLVVLPLGFFDDGKEGDLRRHPSPRLSLALAYAFVDDAKKNRGILGAIPADGGTTDTHNVTGDVVLKWRGLSLFGVVMWRRGQRQPGDRKDPQGQPIPVALPRNGLGVSVQGGYVLPKPVPLQFALRFSHIQPLDPATSSLTLSRALGGAISYYFAGHPFKLQADYFFLWGDDSSKGTHQIRVQLQAGL